MISIIVPVYKAEPFLSRCVDSILNQTYEDWELLLIDDGSPDRSGDICDEYANQDPRIRVFHKANGGVSSARNLGLDNAKGDWISFIDADDYILPSFLENLANNVNDNINLIISGYRRFGLDNSEYLIPHNKTIDTHSFVKMIFAMNAEDSIYTNRISYPWGKLIKKDIVNKNHLRFNINMKLGEDTCFMLQLLKNLEHVTYIKGGDYMYYTSSSPKSHLSMSYDEFQVHLRIMKDTIDELGNIYGFSTFNYYKVMCQMYFCTFLNFLKSSDYKQFYNQLKLFKEHNHLSLNILLSNTSLFRRFVHKCTMTNSLLYYFFLKYF